MWRPPTHDLYDLLGVPPDADVATVRRAWKAKIRQLHPDGRPEHEQAQAHQEAVRLNEACDILTDRFRRADYDLSRGRAATSSGSPPPRLVVLRPQAVDFGRVVIGHQAPDRYVTVRMSDGSPMSRISVLSHGGRFWTNDQYEEPHDVSEFVVLLRGLEISPDLEPGRCTDWVQIEVDGERVRVELGITVEAPPPRPAEPKPAPEPATPMPPRTGRRRRAKVFAVLAAILAVIIGVGTVLHPTSRPSHPRATTPGAAAPVSAPAKPAGTAYCSVPSEDGQVIAYYATTPGTTTKTGPELWDSSPQRKDDPWLDWITPDFPHWERANKHEMTINGHKYKPHERVEIWYYDVQGWESLSGFFARHYGAGSAAEAAGRDNFLHDWMANLGAPECTG